MCGVLQPVGWDAVGRLEVWLQVEEPAWGTAICGFVFFRSWYPWPYAITSAPLPSSYSIVVTLSMSIYNYLRFGRVSPCRLGLRLKAAGKSMARPGMTPITMSSNTGFRDYGAELFPRASGDRDPPS